MTMTIVERLADFTASSTFDSLPAEVVTECKRTLLDSIGCAVAGIDELKGKAGIEYGRTIGGTDPQATIMGTGEKCSVLGAAFANGELINTLDMDVVLFPGHVTPYVLPGALATAESLGTSGKNLIEAMATSHEMSFRLGKAMDYQRDTKDGKLVALKVFGYASTIFGATAAIGHVKRFSRDRLAHALGIAGYISPVNPQIAWFDHMPNTTIKYLMAGMLAQQALTAAAMSELGHRGDLLVLDDRDIGYPRFVGTTKWEPEQITRDLGSVWNFPAHSVYKPYPHCRIMHGMMDCLISIVQKNRLAPGEIDAIKVYVEGIGIRPCWTNRKIELAQDAQFSMAHGISVAAHLIPPGKAWMDPQLIHSPSVMSLMDKVTTEVHPDYVKMLGKDAASRPARVEVRARGKTFVQEKAYPKGTPSPDADTFMTNDELVTKFRNNCEGVLSASDIDAVVDGVMGLESIDNVASLMQCAGKRAGDGLRVAAKPVAA